MAPAQGAEHVLTRHGQIVYRAGFDIGHPQRETVWPESACTLPPCSWDFPEYHKSICSPFTLVVFSPQRQQRRSSVEDHMGQTLLLGLLQGFVQIWRLVGEHSDDLIEVAVRSDREMPWSRPSAATAFCRNHRNPNLLAGAATASFGPQQPGDLQGKSAGDPSMARYASRGAPGSDLIFAIQSCQELPAHISPAPNSDRANPPSTRASNAQATRTRDDLAEITSKCPTRSPASSSKPTAR